MATAPTMLNISGLHESVSLPLVGVNGKSQAFSWKADEATSGFHPTIGEKVLLDTNQGTATKPSITGGYRILEALPGGAM